MQQLLAASYALQLSEKQMHTIWRYLCLTRSYACISQSVCDGMLHVQWPVLCMHVACA